MSTFPGGFVPVAPPADGLRLAFVAARRRRNRKAGASGAAGLLAAVALLASVGGGGDRTLLQEPVPPANNPGLGLLPSGGDQELTQSTPPATTTSTQVHVAGAPTTGGGSSQVGGTGAAQPDDRTTDSSTSKAGARTASKRPISGPMKRSDTLFYTNGDLVCPARKQQERQRGFCTDLVVNQSQTGVWSLTAEICNVGTQTELLSFATALEVDLRIKQSGLEVWRWSLGRQFAQTPHEMTVGTQTCIRWTTEWAQVDSHGVPVKAGTYQVVGDLMADEVAGPDRHPSYPLTISPQS